MNDRIFVAGATGAIGRRLVPMLIEAGHPVTGSTRSAEKADRLVALGVEPAIVDVFDAAALTRAVLAAQPRIVIHQLTDLPPNVFALEPCQRAQALERNARIRSEGTRNLVDAARAANAQRLIAQSIGWLYAPGPEPHTEDDPLEAPTGSSAVTVNAVSTLERLTLQSPPLVGTVLRYGMLYGPGTGRDQPAGSPAVHVDAAAWAAVLAARSPHSGIFNIAEPNAYVATDRAAHELGWDSSFRATTRQALSVDPAKLQPNRDTGITNE